jgi:hypothetical protein
VGRAEATAAEGERVVLNADALVPVKADNGD